MAPHFDMSQTTLYFYLQQVFVTLSLHEIPYVAKFISTSLLLRVRASVSAMIDSFENILCIALQHAVQCRNLQWLLIMALQPLKLKIK